MMKQTPGTSAPVFDADRTPHLFSDAELVPIFELNTLFIEWLAAAAQGASSAMYSWMCDLQPQLGQLAPASRARIARSPICLIDAGFQNEESWDPATRAANTRNLVRRTVCPPDEQLLELAQMTATLAWKLVRVNLEAACIIFGMSARCGRLISGLGVHPLTSLAVRHSQQIRPVWADDSQIWQHLLSSAEPPPTSRLPPLHVRVMQRQLAEVVLATRGSQPSQRSRP